MQSSGECLSRLETEIFVQLISSLRSTWSAILGAVEGLKRILCDHPVAGAGTEKIPVPKVTARRVDLASFSTPTREVVAKKENSLPEVPKEVLALDAETTTSDARAATRPLI